MIMKREVGTHGRHVYSAEEQRALVCRGRFPRLLLCRGIALKHGEEPGKCTRIRTERVTSMPAS